YQMTELYCFVDESLKAQPRLAHWRQSPHAHPHFSDAEALTIALLQGVFAVATLKQTYRLVAQNWRAAFPHLPSYKKWVARLHRLWLQVGGGLGAPCDHAPGAARVYLGGASPPGPVTWVSQPTRHSAEIGDRLWAQGCALPVRPTSVSDATCESGVVPLR